MNILGEENLKKLICKKCENPLSVPPITYNLDGAYFCGRCSSTSQTTHRFEIYEILAQNYTFPCKFSKFGCNQMVKWGEVGIHETVCRKRQFSCPVTSVMQCPWHGNLIQILDHMSKKHRCLTINEINCIKIKVSACKNVAGWRIILLEGKNYLFCVNFNDRTKVLEFSLIRLKYGKINEKYRFNLFSEDLLKEIQLPIQRVNSYEMKRSIKIQNGNSISQDAINYLVNRGGELFCKITFQLGDEKKSSDSIPNILQCPICYHYMKSPIYQCQTGHSFCSACTSALEECAMCKGKMVKIRNFALEDIANEFIIECKNKLLGCNFTGFSTEVEEHQETCKIESEANKPPPKGQYVYTLKNLIRKCLQILLLCIILLVLFYKKG